MNRTKCKKLAKEIEAALQPLAAKHGLQIVAKGGKFDDTTYTAKIECSELNGDVAQTPERAAFTTQAQTFGLKPELLDTTFEHRGQVFKIVGLRPNAPRYPVVAMRMSDGKRYKFAADAVALLLEVEGVA